MEIQQDLAIRLMHHPSKGKARPGEWSRGSSSLPASVDIALEMHPCSAADLALGAGLPTPRSARVSRPRRRLLLGWSRHEETPRRRLIEWTADGGDYQVLAEASNGEFDRGWSALRRVPCAVEGPQTAAAILRHWPADTPPPSRATLHRWLARALQRGWLCWEASHRRNAPYRYWLPPAKER
jgi:hypothetical protein